MNVRNRGCIRRLSFRTLRAAWKRNAIAVAAIALTALLFTSLFTVALSINSSYETYTFRQIGGYCHGTFKEVSEEQARAIAAHPNVKAVGKRTTVGFLDTGVFAKVPAEVSFMDDNCTTWSYARPQTGHAPKGGKEVTMDTEALRLLGVEPKLGAQITLTFTVGDDSQTAYKKTDTFALAGWWEYDELSPVHYINISQEYAQAAQDEAAAAGLKPFRTDLNVMLASPVDIRGQMERVDSDLGYSWEQDGSENVVRIGVNWGYTSARLGESVDAATVLAGIAFLVLIIFTGYLIIYNIFQISVTGDIRYYGLLKTIGVTPRQLRRIIRWQACLLWAAGIPLGLLLGYGVGAGLTPVVMARTTFGAGVSTVSTSPLIFLAAALFTFLTVLLSCARPGRIAAKVSPVEAVKYTEAAGTKRKRRGTRGAGVRQMALANLGRNRSKTVLVVLSLALSVVLLNVLVTFTGGIDTEKYLAKQTCADFIVSSTDYFRFRYGTEEFFSQDVITDIQANTTQSLSGCGYKWTGAVSWISEEGWRAQRARFGFQETAEAELAQLPRRGALVGMDIQLEGLDDSLFEKLTVVDGDLSPLFRADSHAIALAVPVDDYGNVIQSANYPPIGSTQTITYVEDAYYIDNRTGEPCDENTPEENIEYYVAKSHDVAYTVCAYVTVPYAMSYRYGTLGYSFVLPVSKLARDGGKEPIPMVYLFDTPGSAAEEAAERYLAALTGGENAELMYESKATLRAEVASFRSMFLLLGGLLCAIIGLVGILNFFNAMMTSILSRGREFAVLQAVGMTGRQLKRMLLWEGLLYTLGSGLAAGLLSMALNPLLGGMLERACWFYRYRFSIIPVVVLLPVFALLGCAIPAAMYRRAAKQSVVERLRAVEVG